MTDKTTDERLAEWKWKFKAVQNLFTNVQIAVSFSEIYGIAKDIAAERDALKRERENFHNALKQISNFIAPDKAGLQTYANNVLHGMNPHEDIDVAFDPWPPAQPPQGGEHG